MNSKDIESPLVTALAGAGKRIATATHNVFTAIDRIVRVPKAIGFKDDQSGSPHIPTAESADNLKTEWFTKSDYREPKKK